MHSNCVKKAIPLVKALFLQDNEEYFIVGRYDGYGDCYWNGFERLPIEIIKNNPSYELAKPIDEEGNGNLFLIKGYFDSELTELAEEKVLVAEEWEIIVPIHRCYRDENENARFFAPRNYLDVWDVESGGYSLVLRETRTLSYVEMEYIQKNDDRDTLLVTSEYVDGKVQWYIGRANEQGAQITLTGNSFEEYFGEDIFKNRENVFLICGAYDVEHGVFDVEEWHIVGVICNKEYTREYGTWYYFTQDDIETGIYRPEGEKKGRE